jgi:hypothetical protein
MTVISTLALSSYHRKPANQGTSDKAEIVAVVGRAGVMR